MLEIATTAVIVLFGACIALAMGLVAMRRRIADLEQDAAADDSELTGPVPPSARAIDPSRTFSLRGRFSDVYRTLDTALVVLLAVGGISAIVVVLANPGAHLAGPEHMNGDATALLLALMWVIAAAAARGSEQLQSRVLGVRGTADFVIAAALVAAWSADLQSAWTCAVLAVGWAVNSLVATRTDELAPLAFAWVWAASAISLAVTGPLKPIGAIIGSDDIAATMIAAGALLMAAATSSMGLSMPTTPATRAAVWLRNMGDMVAIAAVSLLMGTMIATSIVADDAGLPGERPIDWLAQADATAVLAGGAAVALGAVLAVTIGRQVHRSDLERYGAIVSLIALGVVVGAGPLDAWQMTAWIAVMSVLLTIPALRDISQGMLLVPAVWVAHLSVVGVVVAGQVVATIGSNGSVSATLTSVLIAAALAIVVWTLSRRQSGRYSSGDDMPQAHDAPVSAR